jgi:galactose-1-phosphate uridylyltransferase
VLFGYIYRNLGKKGGATQAHEHMQIRSFTNINLDGILGRQIAICTKEPEIMKKIVDCARKKNWVYMENSSAVCFAVPWEETNGIWIVYNGEKRSFDEMNAQEIDLFNEATQETLRRLCKHGYMDLNLGLFDAPRDQAKNLPVHAKVITCKKVRGATDKLIGPERNDMAPNQFKELLSNA